jgi:AcrR family transcriptional regulator
MARPASIREEHILDVARRVFMAEGYKAGTARIAREAGVSEGSLFKHFKTKTGLFLAAMDVQTGEPAWQERFLAGAGKGDLRATLEAAGAHLLQRLRTLLPRLMMVTASGITLPRHCGDRSSERPPVQHIKLMTRFFKAEIRAGRMVMDTPEIHAHAFMGALSHYAWCETMLGYRPASPRAYVRGLVGSLLQFAAAHAATPPSRRPHP